MLTLPTKLLAAETLVLVVFLVLLIMGLVYTFGTYRHDKDKKQAGFIMLGTAGIIASVSVMPLIMDSIKDQADAVMGTASLLEGLRDLFRSPR
jgi:uncharacterized membrane protein HdeD (DUF308 family)